MRILVTAGATREPIDAVRFLSNVSSGRTGAALVDEFVERGHHVVHLHGEGATFSARAAEREMFSSAADLQLRLERRLSEGRCDAVVMAAAVADYRPTEVADGKLPSDAPDRLLRLVRNEKILPRLKAAATGPLGVVGFKLTVDADAEQRREAVMAQFATGGVDVVVQNDLGEIRRATLHPFWVWRSADAAPRGLKGVPALAEALLEMLAAPSP